MSRLPEGWVETTLGEVAEVKGGKRLPKGKELIPNKTGHAYIRITDLENNSIKKEQLQFVDDDIFQSIARYIVNTGDVILSIVGTIGLVAKIDKLLDEANLTENCVKLTDLKDINENFLFYYLISRFGQYEINKNTVGAVQKKLPIYGVKNIQINLPPLPEQKVIAAVLLAFDDKIELLREQNRTLETLAQTIFKEWFVHFNFPCLPQDYRPSGQVNLPSQSGQVNLNDLNKVCTYQRVGGLPAPDGKSWFVYVILCEDGSFYKGITQDLYYRFYQHFTGKGADWTKAHKPEKIIHWEQFDSKEDAAKREKELKTGYGRTWLQRQYEKTKAGSPAPEYKLRKAGEMVDLSACGHAQAGSELGEFPLGWKAGKLGEEFDITMGQSPKGETYNEIGNGMIFFQGRAEFQERFPKRRLYTTDPKRIAEQFDVLMSVRAPVGDINVASEKCCIGRGLSAVSSQYKSYALYKMKSIAREFKHFESAGTVFGSINKSTFENIAVIIPSQNIIESYNSIVSVMDNKIFNNTTQIQTLSKTRDTLLPKLMSGEIRVKGFEQ